MGLKFCSGATPAEPTSWMISASSESIICCGLNTLLPFCLANRLTAVSTLSCQFMTEVDQTIDHGSTSVLDNFQRQDAKDLRARETQEKALASRRSLYYKPSQLQRRCSVSM